MTAPLVDQIETLGAAVDDGTISRDEAIRNLAQWSDGGLTVLGATGLIDDWKSARAQYEAVFDQAAQALRDMGVDPDALSS